MGKKSPSKAKAPSRNEVAQPIQQAHPSKRETTAKRTVKGVKPPSDYQPL